MKGSIFKLGVHEPGDPNPNKWGWIDPNLTAVPGVGMWDGMEQSYGVFETREEIEKFIAQIRTVADEAFGALDPSKANDGDGNGQ